MKRDRPQHGMPDPPRKPIVFVSFTKREGDRDFVRRLLPRLSAQPLDVWIYEDPAGEIPGGAEIASHLREKIDACDAFLPVVTTGAFASEYTQLEVAYACGLRQQTGSRPMVIPCVSQTVLETYQGAWPGAYRSLMDLRYRVVDVTSGSSLETALVGFCGDLAIEYQPLLPEDPRLPLMDRFVAEIREKCPQRDEQEIGIFRRLMAIFSQFVEAFEQERYERALWLIQHFCMTINYEFPEANLYYPYIVQAVCQLLLEQFDLAEQTLEGLKGNPLLDESWHGGLGYLKQRRRDYHGALSCFLESQRLRPDDPGARSGVIANSVMLGVPIDVDEMFAGIDWNLVRTPADHGRLQSLKLLALAGAGRFADAVREFESLLKSGFAEPSDAVQLADHLAGHDDLRGAMRVLKSFQTKYKADAELLHHLAMYSAFAGDLRATRHHFDELIEFAPQSRRYRLDAAQIAWRQGDRKYAQSLVLPLFDPDKMPLPSNAEDYFFDGFANWILNQPERAEYDFARSGFPPEKHYRYLLPNSRF